MERLAQLLSEEIDLASFGHEDLGDRRQALAAAVRQARAGGATHEVLGLMRTGLEQVKAIDAEIAGREADAAQVEADADSALGELDAIETAAPLAASTGLVRGIVIPARSRPRPTQRGAGGGYVMVASGAGAERVYRDEGELLEAINTTAQHTRASETALVASIQWRDSYAPDAIISDRGARDENTATLQRVSEQHRDRMRARAEAAAAMVSSGGVPGPGEAIYSVTTFGDAARPLRAGLPSALMKRGEVAYNQSPTMADLIVDTGSTNAIGTVTSAQDLVGAAKGVQEMPAPTPLIAIVEANYMRFSQGNFADRFVPELTAAYLKLGQVRYARHNDARRFADIKAGATRHFVDTLAKFGALRDLKRAVLGITEELGDQFRDPDLPIHIMAPEFLPAMLASDLIAQSPGDSTWSITEDAVRANLEAMDPSISWSWVWDGTQTGQRLLQTPGGQSPRIPTWDNDVDLLIYPEGAWVFGDGGMLDLGILRDSVVSATNRFQTFLESWECVIPVVPVSYCATLSLCASGVSQAAAAVTGTCGPEGS